MSLNNRIGNKKRTKNYTINRKTRMLKLPRTIIFSMTLLNLIKSVLKVTFTPRILSLSVHLKRCICLCKSLRIYWESLLWFLRQHLHIWICLWIKVCRSVLWSLDLVFFAHASKRELMAISRRVNCLCFVTITNLIQIPRA